MEPDRDNRTPPRRAPAMALLRWLRVEQRLGAGLSPSAAHVLAVIASYVSAEGEAWPSVATLAEDTGASERTVQRGLGDILGHRRAPLRRTLGQHHESAIYTVTDTAYAALAGRGPYARVSQEAPPKAAGVAAEVEAAGAPPLDSGVTPVSPLAPTGNPVGVTPVSPLTPPGRPGGVTPMTLRGDTGVAHIRKNCPVNGTETIETAAAAGAREQQQQRVQAEVLVAEIVAVRKQRLEIEGAAGDGLRNLDELDVIAQASAFRPNPRVERLVQATDLRGMTAAYLARTLLELRRWASAERAGLDAELLDAQRAREVAEDRDPTLPVPDAARQAACTSWTTLLGALPPAARDDHWTRRLLPAALVRGVLYVVAPNRGFAAVAEECGALQRIRDAAAAVGLTCDVLCGTYGELRAALADTAVPAGKRAPPGPTSKAAWREREKCAG